MIVKTINVVTKGLEKLRENEKQSQFRERKV